MTRSKFNQFPYLTFPLPSQATDGDQPGTVNSMLSYSISPTTNFGIQSSTGVINAFELDCETAMTHTLIVTATDAGTSPRTGSATINVRLQVSHYVHVHVPTYNMDIC